MQGEQWGRELATFVQLLVSMEVGQDWSLVEVARSEAGGETGWMSLRVMMPTPTKQPQWYHPLGAVA